MRASLRLASHMRCSLAELYQRFTSPELTVWYGFYAIEGWPEQRADYRAAFTSWTIASCNGGKHKLEDFVPNFDPQPSNSWMRVKAYFQALTGG